LCRILEIVLNSLRWRIYTEESFYEKVSSIIGLQPESYKFGWSYTIVFEEQKDYIDIIAKFLDCLEGKDEKLQRLGINNTDINIWIIYAYNNQCNMGFEPNTLERLGRRGIKLSISCYRVSK